VTDYDFAANLHGAGAQAAGDDDYDFAKSMYAVSAGVHETPTGRPVGQQRAPIEGSGVGLIGNFLAGFPEDQDTKLEVLARHKFPNDPRAVERFGMSGGRPVFRNERGEVEYADTGVGSNIGSALAYVPEFVGGAIGSLATANPFSGSVVGSVGGKGVKQIIAGTLMDEPQTTGGNVGGMATEGVTSAVGGALAKGGSALYNRAAVRNAEKFDLGAAKQLRERILKSTGIDLDLAQAGNIRQLRDLKKWASKYPSDAQEIIEALDRKQAGQVAGAIEDKILKQLSSETDPAKLASSGVNAAKGALAAAETVRAGKVRPLYEKAYADLVDPTTTKEILKADPVIAGTLRRVMGNAKYKRDLEGAPQNSIRTLDLVKRDLDDQISEAEIAGRKNDVRILTRAKNDLLEFMDAHSPAYRAARAEYAKQTKEIVEPLENGVIGVLAKIEGPRAAQDVARVIDDILANPQATSAAKLILQKQGPQAWRDVVKLSLSKAFDKASKETQSGDVVNLAGKFRQSVIGTPQRKAAMEKAIGPEGAAAFNDVMDALQLIAKEGRNRAGSDTEFNRAITRQQSGGTVSSAARSLAAPLRTFGEIMDEGIFERNSVAFAEALTDPAKLARLKELRKMPPGTERAVATLATFGFGVGGSNVLRAPAADKEPPQQ